MFLVDIVQNILKLAKEKKITNQQLCKILETNPNKIYDWKIGKSKPSAEDISKLADCFDVSTDYLLGRKPSPEIENNGNIELPLSKNKAASLKELYEVASQLPEKQVLDVLEYAQFKKQAREKIEK